MTQHIASTPNFCLISNYSYLYFMNQIRGTVNTYTILEKYRSNLKPFEQTLEAMVYSRVTFEQLSHT